MLRFTLFRVPIIIHPSMWLMLIFFSGIFSLRDLGGFVDVLTFVAAGFISLLSHELGHALVGRALAGGNPQIYFEWLGGNCWNPNAQFTRTKGLIMTAAGPLANILLCLISFGTLYFFFHGWDELMEFIHYYDYPPCYLTTGVMSMLRNIGLISLFLTLFNLLPIYPLDGGQLMAGLMESMRAVLQISVVTSGIMILVAFILHWWVFLLFFILMTYFNFKRLRLDASS